MPIPLTVPPVRDTSVFNIDVDGQLFRVVYDAGTESGPPLLLMNGIGARLELLQPLVDRLGPERTVIRFDVPGVGESALASRPYRFRGLAKQIAGILDYLEVDQVDVLGISWGGALAQQFAFSQSKRTRRLILVSTAAGMIMVPAHPRVLAKMLTHRRYTDPDYLASVADVLYGGDMRINPTEAVAAMRAHGSSHNGLAYFMQLGAGLGWTSIPFLPRIKAPTFVMSGNDDPLIPAINAKLLAKLIPNSRLSIFEGGHLSLVTEAHEHAPEIDAFLDQDDHEL